MDFHSLTRKELQALCKKNKIPANITNVAMADALAALETVEGLEEFLNQSQLPENGVLVSPTGPRTATRTATRRKPTKEEPETAQPTTRTRGRTRRAIDQDLDQEDKNVNVVETPAIPASRRRAPAASASRKKEAQVMVETPAGRRRTQVGVKVEEGSVYSTRRSVRLLEKSMGELSLKEPVKMDVLDETEEKAVSGNLEKTNDSSSVESCIGVMESERELKVDVQGKDKCEDNGLDASDNLDNVLVLDAKDESNDETYDELDKMGPVDDVPVTEFTSESENPSANVYDEISAEDHKADDESGDDAHVLVSEPPPETEIASAEVIKTENVTDGVSPNVAAEVLLEEEDLELPFDPDSWETDSDQSVKESNAVNVFPSDANVDNNESDFQKSVAEKAAEGVEKERFPVDNAQVPHVSENIHVEMEESASEGLVDVNLIEGEVVISHDDNPPNFAKEASLSCPPPFENESTSEIDLISEDKAVAYAEDLESKKDMIDVDVMPSEEYDFAANLPPLPDTPTSGEKMSPCRPVSGSKIVGSTIATQFPRPTQSTPSKNQTTDQRVPPLPADNKENIDTSGMKVEPKKDKVKKKKNIIDVESLNEKSLRELTKMFKETVQIHNKKISNDEAQVGKTTRPALQTLTENVMLPQK